MQGSHAAPLMSCRPDREVGMEGTGQGCGLFRKNHNSVQVSSSRGALWVAATEPLFHSSYLLNPCPTRWHCQKDKVPSVHVFCCFVCLFVFNVNINLVGFMSLHTATPNLWKEKFQSLPNWTFQCLMCANTLYDGICVLYLTPISAFCLNTHGNESSWNWSMTHWGMCCISWCCSGKWAITLTMLL